MTTRTTANGSSHQLLSLLIEVLSYVEPDSWQQATPENWCPVLAFGDIAGAEIATIGLNPSDREFRKVDGTELSGNQRRFPTLESFALNSWLEADHRHLDTILSSYSSYFLRNSYDGWFKRLSHLIEPSGFSYYFPYLNACHLDIVPVATEQKWGELTQRQQEILIEMYGQVLISILASSNIHTVILNGMGVINRFAKQYNVKLSSQRIVDADLRSETRNAVPAYGYSGILEATGLDDEVRRIRVLGFNHNIQSTFGMTNASIQAISEWLVQNLNEQT